ncbi:FUSC family protein [Streptomyces sp900116325]|uniref:FUSC family protein n=1 Tax=Streptomyces sp. 900116325 TaxID=3154295 RepID=UPI0033A804B8
MQLLRRRDVGLAALRRACRAGIVAPGLFALGVEGIGNVTMATFAAFSSIALLLFVDFAGPLRERLAAQGSLVVAGVVMICLGTLVAGSGWPAAVVTVLVGFGVLFSGAVSSVIASSSTSLLATLLLAVTLPGSVESIPERLAGYLMAGAVSLIVITVLWPTPDRRPLRRATAQSCSLLAGRLRAEVDCVRGNFAADRRKALDESVAEASAAVAALRKSFFDAPYRPTGLTTEARTLVRLVDEVVWLEEILKRMPLGGRAAPSDAAVCEVMLVAADLLERGADRLDAGDGDAAGPRLGQKRLRDARTAMERAVTSALPVTVSTDGQSQRSVIEGFISSLEPSFRAQEVSIAVCLIAENIELRIAARDRRWWERALGRRPAGVSSPLSAVQERAGAHIEPHSVWLHNSLRGAVALGLAVLVAEFTGVQHSFWVAFGTMAVLRSNALLTGQNALRALLGTVVGIMVGGGLIFALGSDTTVFWILLPPAIVFTGLAPTAISFAAGQAGFTAALLIMFNIIEPAGRTIGLVRLEDISIGCAVSACVGILFWPRGAGAALGQATAEAFAESASYLRSAIENGVARSDALAPNTPTPDDERRRAAAAARRLDDAFRCLLAERGTKYIALADVTALMTTVAVLRLTADAIVDLWEQEDDGAAADHTTARADIVRFGLQVCKWYEESARALSGFGQVPERPARDGAAADRLINELRRDLTDGGGQRGANTAIRVIWTAYHIDVARKLQTSVEGPTRAAAALQNRMNMVAGRAGARRQPPHSTSA